MSSLQRIDRLLLSLGLLVASFLLIRFAIDLSAQMPLLISAPFWILVISSLVVLALNALTEEKRLDSSSANKARLGFFLAAVPVAFFVSSLDCAGLSLSGCSPFCTFIKLVWIPLMALAGAAYFFTRKPGLLTLMLSMSFVPLVPHCVCYNAANAWWIDRVGDSPECFIWGYVVSLIAFGAIGREPRQWISGAIIISIIAGGLGFFVGHHFFQFPW